MLKLLIRLTVFSIFFTSCVLQAPSNKRATDDKTSKSAVEVLEPQSTALQTLEMDKAFAQFDVEIRDFSQSNASAILALDRFNQKSRVISNTAQKVLEQLTLAGNFTALKTAKERQDFLENVAMKKILEVVKLTEDQNLGKAELKDFSDIPTVFNDYQVFSKKLMTHLGSMKKDLNDTYAVLNEKLTAYKKYFEQSNIQQTNETERESKTTANFIKVFGEGRRTLENIKRDLRNIAQKYDEYSDEQREAMLNQATILTDAAIVFGDEFLLELRHYAVDERLDIYESNSNIIESSLIDIRDLNLLITRSFIKTEHFSKSLEIETYDIKALLIDDIVGKGVKAKLDSHVLKVLRLLESVPDARSIETTKNKLTERISQIEKENLALKEKNQFLSGYKGTLLKQMVADNESAIRLMAVLQKTYPNPPELTEIEHEKVIEFNSLLFKVIFSQMIADGFENRAELISAWKDVLPLAITDEELKAITKFGRNAERGVVSEALLRSLRSALKIGSEEVIKILK